MRRLKNERLKRSIRSDNFAKELGITYVYLSKIEMAHLEPSVKLAKKICEYFNDNSDFSLLEKYPSTQNMKFDEFVLLSKDLGYYINTYLFESLS